MLLESDGAPLEKAEPERAHSAGRASILGQSFLWLLQSLRPSFLTKSPASKQRLRKTAYLDGIRGFAAFLVYCMHHILWAHEAYQPARKLESSFGSHNEYYFGAFPFIRTFFTGGHVAVAVFFIVSGFALSAKPISLMHSGDLLAMADNLASAAFRRWFRLYIPIIATTLIIILMYHGAGVFMNFIPEASLGAELDKWYREFRIYSFIYGAPHLPWFSYHPHTWTIPVEFRGSIVVYLAASTLSRTSQTARLWCVTGLMVYFMYITDGAYYAMFTAGFFLCELDALASADRLPRWITTFDPYKAYIFPSMLVIGLYLGGCPSFSNEINWLRDENPGWYILSSLKPTAVFDFKWFYLFWAALMIIISVPHVPIAKRFFDGRFCQYLGRIAYMFYLVHGPVLWTVGDRIYAIVGWTRMQHELHQLGWSNRFPLPKWGPLGMEVGFLLPHLILLPMTFWFAEIGTALIDTPSIKFGSWLYKVILPFDESRR